MTLLLWAGGGAAAGDTTLQSAIDRFVTLDCEVGEAGRAGQALRTHGDTAIPSLRELLEDGPDPSALQTMQEEIERRWEARQDFLESSGVAGLSIASQQNVSLRDHDDYVNRRLERFQRRVRERAALGLAAIGSPAARRALLENAAGPDGPLNDLIDRLIRAPKSRRGIAARAHPPR